MKYRIVKKDWKGRILFTEEELVDLLDSVYREGYMDALKIPQAVPEKQFWGIKPTWAPGTDNWKITCEDSPDGFGKMSIVTEDGTPVDTTTTSVSTFQR